MKLFSGKVAPIASEAVRALLAAEAIEAEAPKEVEKDVEAVLKNYLDLEREVNERAKDLLERTGKAQSDFNRMRTLAASEKGIKIGDETLDFVLDQVVEMFHHSSNVDEIFAEDVEMRRLMAPCFKKHMNADSGIDADVRAQLKHLKEGTPDWEIEYGRVAEGIRRRKGLI
jgi:hypothetical protein